MGLTGLLGGAAGSDSIPILLVVTAATWVSYLRSFLLYLLHPFPALHRLAAPVDEADAHLEEAVGSGLASLILLAERLGSEENRPFSHTASAGDPSTASDCAVCLCGYCEGESLRRLPCRHVFHLDCLDRWFEQRKLSCPVCRSQLVPDERLAEAERRIGAELIAWLTA